MNENSDSPSSPSSMTPYLGVHEWVAIISILGFLLLLTLIVLDGRHDNRSVPVNKTVASLHFKPQEVEIYIDGAVKNPGSYKVKLGTSTRDAIELAEPLEDADLSKIKPTSRVRNGQNIKVPGRQMLKIIVSGAIQNPGTITIPKGTRLSELSNYVVFADDADLSKISRKRYLKDNEEVIVPVIIPKKVTAKNPPKSNKAVAISEKAIQRSDAKKLRTRRLIAAQKHTQRLWSQQ